MKRSHRTKAEELYISPLFKMNLAYAKSMQPDKIFILSAKYGLLDLETEINPYEQTLNTMPVKAIKAWAEKVKSQAVGKINFDKNEIIFLAGERYRRFLLPFCKHAKIPMQGLGIGRQLQFLKNKISNEK